MKAFAYGLLLPAVQPAIDNLGIQPPVDPGGGVRSQHTGGVNAVMHDGSVRSDEGPEENLAVDPTNPNNDVTWTGVISSFGKEQLPAPTIA